MKSNTKFPVLKFSRQTSSGKRRQSNFSAIAVVLLSLMAASPTLAAQGASPAHPGNRQARALQAVLETARRTALAASATATIMQDGVVVWQGASGKANIKQRVPATTSTLYSIASITKMFVSTMVLRLSEEGKLNLDDPIHQYVPDYIPNSDQVTIRHLLAMTSGYPEVEADPVIDAWLLDPNHIWTRTQLLQRIQPVTFTPGTQFSYVNGNYILLGRIIESVSPLGIAGEFHRLIQQPLGIEPGTSFRRQPSAAPRIAHGYQPDETGLLQDTFEGATRLGVPTSVWGTVWTDGGIAATSNSVARFTDALFGGRLLQPATLEQMTTPGLDGSYGLGTVRVQFNGRDLQGHAGAFNGFTSVSLYDLSRRTTFTVLTNTLNDAFPSVAIATALATAYGH